MIILVNHHVKVISMLETDNSAEENVVAEIDDEIEIETEITNILYEIKFVEIYTLIPRRIIPS